ncbi:DNA-binding protein [Coniochaeta ligniaria NRRL 30616]|uniref:DNA-binding protein n=1 Tax=Coniochaeta ligniaria NRRL 30616 TaxID=1408157 RepID=A0A1J7IZJ8_9PEZI|nr:DNA-binding protein [Coniochaeta ligniaria NRRL 30616]
MSAQEPTLQHEVPLKEAHTLITTFTTFLTVSIHNILYYRHIYPSPTFLTSRAYNLPVHQNRHPKVCSWIRDAVAAVAAQLALGTVDRVAVVIHAPLHPEDNDNIAALPPGAVLERYLFDVSRFPSWPGGPDAMRDYGNSLRRRDEEDDDDRFAPAAPDEEDGEDGEASRVRRESKINWTNVGEQFRGVLRRLSHAAEKLDPVPAGCTFTVAVELRDEAAAPIGVRNPFSLATLLSSHDGRSVLTHQDTQHPQPWIPSQPNLQKPRGVDLGGARTTPIRSVEAGPLFFECWVEEGKAKEILRDAAATTQDNNTQSSMS